jgi:hypothetical protein
MIKNAPKRRQNQEMRTLKKYFAIEVGKIEL